jgi:hypothetical protein
MESLEPFAPFLAGPAAAVLVMLLVLGALYQLTTKQLVPLLASALDRHLKALDTLVETNQKDHQVIILALEGIRARMDTSADITNPGV